MRSPGGAHGRKSKFIREKIDAYDARISNSVTVKCNSANGVV